MSKFTDAIASEPPQRKGPPCGLVRIRLGLPADDAEHLDRLLGEVQMGQRTAASVSRILKRAGFHWTGNMISRHLRGECGCSRQPTP